MSLKEKKPVTDAELELMRHSTSHVMAEAVQILFPGAKFGIGPSIEDGFYYDFDLPRPLTPDDLSTIEAKMKEIISANLPFVKKEVSKEEARQPIDRCWRPTEPLSCNTLSGKCIFISDILRHEQQEYCMKHKVIVVLSIVILAATEPVQTALADAFMMVTDFNQQVDTARKQKSTLYMLNVNMSKIQVSLEKSKQGLEDWLLKNTGAKEPPPKYPGIMDSMFGGR